MSKRAILFFFLTLWMGALHAQSECSMFYPFKEGVKMEYTHYDKKDKVESKALSTVKAVKKLPNGVEAVVHNTVLDKKDEEQFSGEYKVRCENGVIKMDVSAMLNPALQQSFANMEVSIEGKELAIPKQLKVGQALPDASTTINAGTGGINIISMTVDVTDRKVVGQETISTPAGTFECYKLTQTTDVKIMMGKSFSTVEYYAEGVGVVRSETYDKKGKLEGYMVLTAFEK